MISSRCMSFVSRALPPQHLMRSVGRLPSTTRMMCASSIHVVISYRHCTSGGKGSTPTNSVPPSEKETATSSTPGAELSSEESKNVANTDDGPNALVRVKRLPLTLIEEVPSPMRIMSEIELLMTAWCEEHARQYAVILFGIRIIIFILLTIIVYVFYRTQISSERVVRGVKNMPEDLRIGNVVYMDFSENGLDIGRVVIGLLTEQAPLYCEYFHRRCTGNGGQGDSFRGMKMSSMIPRHVCIFGDGPEMTHDVPGFEPHSLPSENISGVYRGALSSIANGPNKESPNFAMHLSSGDYSPQVFGLIIGGYDVLERVSGGGVKHGNCPKCEITIEECGELCTLDKAHIVPMPWKLYHNVSVGMDQDKFGERMSPSVLAASDLWEVPVDGKNAAKANSGSGKWWKLW